MPRICVIYSLVRSVWICYNGHLSEPVGMMTSNPYNVSPHSSEIASAAFSKFSLLKKKILF